jgi:LmbE family N-acetylglucosaminyl deacetylase
MTLGVLLGAYVFLQAPPLWFVRLAPAEIPGACDATERVLVISPHPDDDILAVGSSIVAFRQAGVPVLVVFLTSGDANLAGKRLITMNPFSIPAEFRALGARRQKEAVIALGRLGVDRSHAVFLNYPDRGLMAMLADHWLAWHPYLSPHTRKYAKYLDNALNPGSAYFGEELLRDLKEILWRFRPTIVYLPHPEDAHDDHRAGYTFARMAVEDVAASCEEFAVPEQRCYLVHYYEGVWPTPSASRRVVPLELLERFESWGEWRSVELSLDAVRAKHHALRAHASQWWTSGFFLRRFICSNELYMLVGAWPLLSSNGSSPD